VLSAFSSPRLAPLRGRTETPVRLRPTAFGLLLAAVFGVTTAAHPCAVVAPDQVAPPAGKTSCHGGMAQPHDSPPNLARHRGCCDPSPSGPQACQNACQGIGVLELPAALTAPGLLMALATPPAERSLSLFVPSIDHVPLA
jgi:hypothetical protein